MNRPDGRIEKGQRLTSAISARAWNRAQDAADIVLGATPGIVAGDSKPFEKASNIVLVYNGTGQTIPVHGVIGIASEHSPGVTYPGVIDPTGGRLSDQIGDSDEQKAKNARSREFFRRPLLRGIMPMAGKNFAVAIEPIPNGAVGRCASGGVFACRVHVVNHNHEYAGARNNDTTRLISANCGRLKLLWVEQRNVSEGLSGPNDADGKWAVGMM